MRLRAAGLYELWSLLALVVIVCILEIHVSREKTDVSLYCLLFKERKWPNGEDGLPWLIRRTKEEIEIHEEF